MIEPSNWAPKTPVEVKLPEPRSIVPVLPPTEPVVWSKSLKSIVSVKLTETPEAVGKALADVSVTVAPF